MIQVACAIIFKGNEILVTQRSERMSLPLKWEFPGGKVEDDETAVECIIREINEEINIEIELIRKLSNSIYDYGSFKIELIPFVANFVKGQITLLEHKDYKFLKIDQLKYLNWADADIPVVNELINLK